MTWKLKTEHLDDKNFDKVMNAFSCEELIDSLLNRYEFHEFFHDKGAIASYCDLDNKFEPTYIVLDVIDVLNLLKAQLKKEKTFAAYAFELIRYHECKDEAMFDMTRTKVKRLMNDRRMHEFLKLMR